MTASHMSSYRRKTHHQSLSIHIRRDAGFSYLWTLLLVAFMGVGLSVASEMYMTSVTREKERELIFIGREFRTAIARYYESNVVGGQRQYPSSLEELLKDSRVPGTHRHLRRIYVDPMTGKREWGTILVQGRVAGIYSLSEKVPIKQDHFEVTEGSFKGKQKYSEWVFTYPSDLLLMGQNNAIASGADNSSRSVIGTVPPPLSSSPVPLNDGKPMADSHQPVPLK